MTFKCKYCGEKFCSEHRLPENHDCEKLEEKIEEKKEETGKWFQEKKVRKEIKPERQKKPSVAKDAVRSIISNATAAIILVTVVTYLLQSVAGFSQLMLLDPAVNELLRRPWSIVTVMLVHGSPFHIFANMVTFFFFGSALERVTGARELLKFYLISGIVASLGYILFRNLLFLVYGQSLGGFPTLGAAVGASGAVVATFAAVAMIYPEAEVLLYFFIPMKIKTALYLFGGI
jgi:Uncharacterized membrane protein (homolog of Drosophila rhomboid)